MKAISISVLLFLTVISCNAQESLDSAPLSVGDRLLKVEETLKNLQPQAAPIELLRRIEKELKSILEAEPHTMFRSQVESDLDVVNERVARHDLSVAAFYMSNTHGHRFRGAEARLTQIVQNCPKFSRMDEVLFRLGLVMVVQEKPDEASQIFWRLICRYPTSGYVNAAFNRLYETGVSSWLGCEQFKP